LYRQIKHDTNRSIIKVAQLADLHIDLNYQEGSNAMCGGTLCCHAD